MLTETFNKKNEFKKSFLNSKTMNRDKTRQILANETKQNFSVLIQEHPEIIENVKIHNIIQIQILNKIQIQTQIQVSV